MTRRVVGANDAMRIDGPARPNTPDERRKAALYVAGMAGDADDARHLLDALGLLDVADA